MANASFQIDPPLTLFYTSLFDSSMFPNMQIIFLTVQVENEADDVIDRKYTTKKKGKEQHQSESRDLQREACAVPVPAFANHV